MSTFEKLRCVISALIIFVGWHFIRGAWRKPLFSQYSCKRKNANYAITSYRRSTLLYPNTITKTMKFSMSRPSFHVPNGNNATRAIIRYSNYSTSYTQQHQLTQIKFDRSIYGGLRKITSNYNVVHLYALNISLISTFTLFRWFCEKKKKYISIKIKR